MRLHDRLLATPPDPPFIAAFGQARLIRRGVGPLELIGGTGQDREEARAWVKMFLTPADGRPTPAVVGLSGDR